MHTADTSNIDVPGNKQLSISQEVKILGLKMNGMTQHNFFTQGNENTTKLFLFFFPHDSDTISPRYIFGGFK